MTTGNSIFLASKMFQECLSLTQNLHDMTEWFSAICMMKTSTHRDNKVSWPQVLTKFFDFKFTQHKVRWLTCVGLAERDVCLYFPCFLEIHCKCNKLVGVSKF